MIEWCIYQHNYKKPIIYELIWMKINITDLPERMYIVAKKATRNLNVQAGEFLHNVFY